MLNAIFTVHDEDEMGRDFVSTIGVFIIQQMLTRMAQMGFLENLVKVFPSLKKRPLYLTGESYSGTYIVRYSLTHALLR